MQEHQEHLFKVILSSVADGVFTVDESRTVMSFNPAAERITGVPASQAIGRKCYEVFHGEICEDGCLLERTLKTGQESIDMPVRILSSDGRRIPVSVSTAVLRDDSGEVLGGVETFRDLTAIEDLRKELEQRYSFEDIITKSPALLKLINILPDVAESSSTVLIQGPSGSGKELFAKAVHNLSPRANKPYVVINCGTLPPQLFESELFGYVKGAFTDAKADKPGKLAGAEGGTVFFDEIGELPLQTQVKLLRLLQYHEYEPVGGVNLIQANIRVVAATNRNLRDMVQAGEFREDLYYRLAVIQFDLPPLRERREDIPLLVDHFIRKFNALSGRNILSVSPTYMETLLRHHFDGNVRELENILEYGYAVCRGRTLEVDHLPLELKALWARLEHERNNPESAAQWNGTPEQPGDAAKTAAPTSPVQRALKEETAIRTALQKTQGHRGRAARLLGMDRTTLWRKMKKYGIEVEPV